MIQQCNTNQLSDSGVVKVASVGNLANVSEEKMTWRSI
jgi:hypothetical protein